MNGFESVTRVRSQVLLPIEKPSHRKGFHNPAPYMGKRELLSSLSFSKGVITLDNILCPCTTKYRSTKQLWIDYLDEVVELIQTPFNTKEWSDCSKGLEDLIERYFHIRLYLGSGINRVQQRYRFETHGCIRSLEKVTNNGGKCLSL